MALPNNSIKAILDYLTRLKAGDEQQTVVDAVTLKINGDAITKTAAQINAAVAPTTIVGITGTIAEFNTACTDADFATGGGTATGSNTGDQTTIVGITGTKAEFNTACSDGEFLYTDSPITVTADKITTGTPVNAGNSAGTLTISGVVKNGETVTFGTDVFEFNTRKDSTGALIPSANIDIDLTGAATLEWAQGTLTVDTQPTAGNTMTIGVGGGEKVYTFVPNGTANADGEITIGTDLATAQAAIVAAINGTDAHNTAHTQVWAAAFGANASVITAFIGGVFGNTIATTETFTAGTNIFDAVVLGTTTAGVDAINTEAATAFETDFNAEANGYTAVDTAGTIVVTADVAGTAFGGAATTDTMPFGAWAAGTTSAGVDGTVADQWTVRVDASWLYVAVAANTIADDNWRRVALGSAY